jgi:hypothetical protein
METLTDEQLRALRFLARRPGGCTETTLLEQDFHRGAAQLPPICGACQATRIRRPKLFQVKITAAGRKAIAE